LLGNLLRIQGVDILSKSEGKVKDCAIIIEVYNERLHIYEHDIFGTITEGSIYTLHDKTPKEISECLCEYLVSFKCK